MVCNLVITSEDGVTPCGGGVQHDGLSHSQQYACECAAFVPSGFMRAFVCHVGLGSWARMPVSGPIRRWGQSCQVNRVKEGDGHVRWHT